MISASEARNIAYKYLENDRHWEYLNESIENRSKKGRLNAQLITSYGSDFCSFITEKHTKEKLIGMGYDINTRQTLTEDGRSILNIDISWANKEN